MEKKLFKLFPFLAMAAILGAGCAAGPAVNTNEPQANAPKVEVSGGGEETPIVDVQFQTVTSSAEVEMKNFSFNPASVTIKKGGKVTWTNRDSANHTVVGEGWQSEPLGSGQTFEKTFGEAGTFDYHCSIHPSMTGKVVVVE